MAKKENKNDSKAKKHFFKDFKAEIKKVIWPTPKQLANNTIAVVSIVLITAAIVFVLDVVFDMGNKYGISHLQNLVNEKYNSEDETETDSDSNSTSENNTDENSGSEENNSSENSGTTEGSAEESNVTEENSNEESNTTEGTPVEESNTNTTEENGTTEQMPVQPDDITETEPSEFANPTEDNVE